MRAVLLDGALAAGVVQGEVLARLPGEDELAHGDDVVALLEQIFQDTRQGLGGVEGGVVEEDDGPGAHVPCHPLGDGGRVIVLPVQAVPAGSGCKGLERKGSEQEGSLWCWPEMLSFYRREPYEEIPLAWEAVSGEKKDSDRVC